jgi:hypothetical protein
MSDLDDDDDSAYDPILSCRSDAGSGAQTSACGLVSHADLESASYSAAPAPASNEKRTRALSELSSPAAPKFPVLRFLGICKAGQSLSPPPVAASCGLLSPAKGGRGARGLCVSASLGASRGGFYGLLGDAKGSPLSEFPPHIPSIIEAGKFWPAREETGEDFASFLGGSGEAIC